MAFPVINGTEVMLPPPDGWQVDFENPTRNNATKYQIYWAFGIEFPIATLFLMQRMYTSAFILKKFRMDDWLILIGWIFLLATQAMILYCWDYKMVGLHAWEQSLDTSIYFTKFVTALTLTAICGTVTAKLTLCIFYFRLSPARWYQYGIYFTSFICIGGFGTVFFAVLFACKPVAASWNLRLQTGDNCLTLPPFYMLQALTGGVTDFLLMIQPIPTVLGLQMSSKYKAALIAWFCIGLVTLAAAIMRLISLLSMITSADTPWTMPKAMLWLVVECNLIVLCGCLPTFRVFLNHFFLGKNATIKSGSGPSSGKNSKPNSHALRTFGQGNSRRFDTIAEIEHGDPYNQYYAGAESEGMRAAGRSSDSDSQEHILQTRTTTVTYSKS